MICFKGSSLTLNRYQEGVDVSNNRCQGAGVNVSNDRCQEAGVNVSNDRCQEAGVYV